MSDPGSLPSARRVNLPEHLWEALETMAREMGGDRDALVAQAVFTLARLNGYVVPGHVHVRAPHRVEDGVRTPAPPVGRDAPRPPTAIGRLRAAEGESQRSSGSAALVEAERRNTISERVADTAAQLEKLARERPAAGTPPHPTEAIAAASNEPLSLFLAADDGKLDPVAKDRFLIGRGKHCDLVINSGKVSREHAAIVHEGEAWYIEDLGSSNGTWFNKQRIKRRKIEDGDEYFVCSEKLRCVFRAAS